MKLRTMLNVLSSGYSQKFSCLCPVFCFQTWTSGNSRILHISKETMTEQLMHSKPSKNNRPHLTPLLKQWIEIINEVRDNTTHIINIAKSTYFWNSYQNEYDNFSLILAKSKHIRCRKTVPLYWSILNWLF